MLGVLLRAGLVLAAARAAAAAADDPVFRGLGVIPSQNPIQEELSYFRVASYNARFLDDPFSFATNLQRLTADLTIMRVFVVVLQEVTLAFFRSSLYAQFKAFCTGFGFLHRCESFLEDGEHEHGTIVISRNPVGLCQNLDLTLGELLTHTEIEYLDRRVTLLASHLESSTADGAEAERVAQMQLLVDYFGAHALDQQYTVVCLDSTQQYSADSIWLIRSRLPVEDSFGMLEWTRPTFAKYEGVTRNYQFLSKNMRGMLIGSYATHPLASDSFASVIDLWQYPAPGFKAPYRQIRADRLPNLNPWPYTARGF